MTLKLFQICFVEVPSVLLNLLESFDLLSLSSVVLGLNHLNVSLIHFRVDFTGVNFNSVVCQLLIHRLGCKRLVILSLTSL